MEQASTLLFHEEERLSDELEEIVRLIYDDFTNSPNASTRLALRQAAREAFWEGRRFEREYGMKTPEKRWR